jgi:competence protein ComEC
VRKDECHFFFRKSIHTVVVLIAGLFVSCSSLRWEEPPAGRSLQFTVFNVGQGLSQMVRVGDTAVVFDMGPQEGYAGWKEQYAKSGRPFIAAMVISHDHADHWGGLQLLEPNVAWPGILYVSPYEDTVALRTKFPLWKERIRFRTIAENGTLDQLDGVAIRCLWPPKGRGDSLVNNEDLKNRYSLVFMVTQGATSALITSDIDTAAERRLFLDQGDKLKSDIFVVPHHGSCGSLDPVFYGYVRPTFALISCGINNEFGHPCVPVLQWLSQMGIKEAATSVDGECLFESNGFYWKQQNP